MFYKLIIEADLKTPNYFVGRNKELTAIKRLCFAKEGPAIALIQGLAGSGKTTLVAEVIHLHHARFDCLLPFQSKDPMEVEEFYRQFDLKLIATSVKYRKSCEADPLNKIFLSPAEMENRDLRHSRMGRNLIEALHREALLIVLDNFEIQLEDSPKKEGYACKNPRWDQLLEVLARELPLSPSRLLVTSRKQPAALKCDQQVLCLPLGRLPMNEAWLYIKKHKKLQALQHSEENQKLLENLLQVTRGYPFLLDHLSALADKPENLTNALNRVGRKGWQGLPDIFATELSEKDQEREGVYLENTMIASIDLLLKNLSPQARQLLWQLSLAEGAVEEVILGGVWSGQSQQDEQLDQIQQMVEMRKLLSKEEQNKTAKPPADLLALLKERENKLKRPPMEPLLKELREQGLVTKTMIKLPEEEELEQMSEEMLQAAKSVKIGLINYNCHEQIKKQIHHWMEKHPEEKEGDQEEDVWIAYGERYKLIYYQLLKSGEEDAHNSAAPIGAKTLTYFVQAQAFDQLTSFIRSLVTGISDPALLKRISAALKPLIDHTPTGETRWKLNGTIADAINASGRPDLAISYYENAVQEAEEAEDWYSVGVYSGNLGIALEKVKNLKEAQKIQRQSAAAYKKAGAPLIDVFGRELEALRIEVWKGNAQGVLPEIEEKLQQIRQWWKKHLRGVSSPEAPDSNALGRILMGALGSSERANMSLKSPNWKRALQLSQENEGVMEQLGIGELEIAINRFNQYGPLIHLDRFDEAQSLVEGVLPIFEKKEHLQYQGWALAALADIWNRRGDIDQAIALLRQCLTLFNQLVSPFDRIAVHNNLSTYLYKTSENEEAKKHQLITCVYNLILNKLGNLKIWKDNLKTQVNQALLSGKEFKFPKLSELLKDSQFKALKIFLEGNKIDITAIESHIDGIVSEVRQEAEGRKKVSNKETNKNSGSQGLSPEIQKMIQKLGVAKAEGGDVDAILNEMKNKLLTNSPGSESQINRFLDSIRAQF